MKTMIRIITSSIIVIGAVTIAFGLMGHLPGWTAGIGMIGIIATYCFWR
jgi:hypothetical protein